MSWNGQLDLFQDNLVLPWNGRSPRSLTRGRKALFLQRERQKNERFFVDTDQVILWTATKRAPWKYQGAPLLMEV